MLQTMKRMKLRSPAFLLLIAVVVASAFARLPGHRFGYRSSGQ